MQSRASPRCSGYVVGFNSTDDPSTIEWVVRVRGGNYNDQKFKIKTGHAPRGIWRGKSIDFDLEGLADELVAVNATLTQTLGRSRESVR